MAANDASESLRHGAQPTMAVKSHDYYSPEENWVTSVATNHFYSPSVYNHVAHIPYMKTKINSEISTENHKILAVRDHSLGRMPDVS